MSAPAHPLPHWTLLSLRPRGQHAVLRRAVAASGGRLLALSPWAIVPRRDDPSRQQLQQALAAGRVVFTSPAAVQAANALLPLAGRAAGRQWLAVGAGTAAALQQAGIARVLAPVRMDSEGLLALPALQDLGQQAVGLVTAPGGRGVIPATLRQRGALLQLAAVYDRVPLRLPARARARLRQLSAPCLLALSSGKALEQLWSQLDAGERAGLLRCQVVAASARLLQQAGSLGFAGGIQARSALPADLLAAARQLLPALPGQACSPRLQA